MRRGLFVLATLAVGSMSPAGDAVREEVRSIQDAQYERGKRAACNIRTLNALTSQDEARIRQVERRCGRYVSDAPPAALAAPQG